MTFEAIKQCAINNDIDGLNRIIAPSRPTGIYYLSSLFSAPILGKSIDVRKMGSHYLTPAGELAREGHFAAVEFLRQRGASVNAIARGLAVGGHFTEAERYRTEHRASVNDIAFGFAVAGNVEKANQCRALGADVDLIAQGFALGGYAAEAERYRTEFGASIDDIAFGFAAAGNVEEVNRCQALGADVDLIAQGFALGGYAAEAERYRTDFGAAVDSIAYGFAWGGHITHAENYRIRFGASVNEIADGFAVSGHVEEAERYRRLFRASINRIACGLAIGGHFKEVERYRTEFGVSVDDIARAYTEGGHVEQAERYQAMANAARLANPVQAMANAARSIDQSTQAGKILHAYRESIRKTPIKILKDYDYPKELCCAMTLDAPVIPVRIFGYGPFDLEAIFVVPDMKLPVLQDVTFEMRDVVPDFVTRDALNKIADELSKTNAVSGPAKVTFAQNAASGADNALANEKNRKRSINEID